MDRKYLLNILDKIGVAVGGGNALTIDTDVIMFHNNYVYSYNGEILFSHPCEININCCVRAKELISTLSKMKGDEIDLIYKNDNLVIFNDTTKLTLFNKESESLKGAIDFVDLTSLEFEKLPENFLSGVSACLFSTKSLDDNLNYIYVKNNQIISCDNYFISRYQMSENINKEFAIPVLIAKILTSLNIAANKYSVEENWIHFLAENNIMFSIRKIIIDYPVDDILKIIKNNLCIGDKYLFPEEIINSIDRANNLSSGNNNGETPYIILEIGNNNIVIKGKNSAGEISDKIKASGIKGLDSKIKVNVSPMLLKNITKITLEFSLTPDNYFIFNKENYVYILISQRNE